MVIFVSGEVEVVADGEVTGGGSIGEVGLDAAAGDGGDAQVFEISGLGDGVEGAGDGVGKAALDGGDP